MYDIMYLLIFILFPSMRTLKQGGISEDSEFEQEIRRMIVYDDYEKLFNVGGGCWRKTCMLVQN